MKNVVEQISDFQGLRMRVRMGRERCGFKRVTEGILLQWNFLYLNCGNGYTLTHVIELHRTQYSHSLVQSLSHV